MINRGDIYQTNCLDYRGNTQAGKRPVIIIQNNIGNQHSPLVIVVPITSKLKTPLPTHCFIPKGVGGLSRNSIALCEQILTLNKTDLGNYMGTVTNPLTLNRLKRCIEISLGLQGD